MCLFSDGGLFVKEAFEFVGECSNMNKECVVLCCVDSDE